MKSIILDFSIIKEKKRKGVKGTFQTSVYRRMALTLLYEEKQKKDGCINP